MTHLRPMASALLAAGLTISLTAQAPDAKFAAAMTKGQAALSTHAYAAALDAFREASRLKKDSPEALFGICSAMYGRNLFASAADTCGDALKYVGDNHNLEAIVRHQRGLVFMTIADQANIDHQDKNRLKALADAEADFRDTLAITENIPNTRYELALSLYRQMKDDDARREMQAFLTRWPNAVEAPLATRILDDPRRARENVSPDFAFTSMEGESISLAALKDKVVLVDFWGTWCGPCRNAVPYLVEYYKKAGKNADFVMLGIDDGDKDENAVRDFVAKNKMTWPENFDRGRMQAAFNVHSFPNYLVINGDGIIVDQQAGFGANGASSDTIDWIESAVKQARSSVPKPPNLFHRP